jgi:hypothetical protein
MGGMTSGRETDNHWQKQFQFRLSELFVFITSAAVVFAMIGRWGVGGTVDRIEAAFFVGSLFVFIMEIHYRIKANLGQ